MSQPVKLMIIGDCCETREVLSLFLKDEAGIQLLDAASNVDEALRLTMINSPDIVLIEIPTPENDGFAYINKIKRYNLIPAVIIVTASEEYAVPAIKHGVFDYLIKPVKKEELLLSIQRFVTRNDNRHKYYYSKLLGLLEKTKPDRIKLNSRTGYFYVDPEQIVYIEADGNHSHIQLASGKKETTTMGLGSIERITDNNLLIRISRSHIINTSYISRVDKGDGICELEYFGFSYQVRITGKKVKLLEQYLNS